MLFNIILFCSSTFFILYFLNYAIKYYKYYQQKRKEEICLMVERIIDVLQSNEDPNGFLVINHVRDMILPINDRKRKYLRHHWRHIKKFENFRTGINVASSRQFYKWQWFPRSHRSPNRPGWALWGMALARRWWYTVPLLKDVARAGVWNGSRFGE